MQTTLFVMSDLHLGGEPGLDGAPGFQICPSANQARLVEFINSLPDRAPGRDVRLVIAGDIVDFLSEVEFRAFSTEADALRKFTRIVSRTSKVWDAIGGFLRRGGALTLMLGNHDIELSLPQVRRLFLKTIGDGRVEFLYDNEAFTCGPVLIEHGNRYDNWNAIRYDDLRHVRSQLSRSIEPDPFAAAPGSQLVANVMNELKREYSFVDLLKPEDTGVLPILAALGAGSLRRYWQLFVQRRNAGDVEFDREQQPRDPTYIAGTFDRDQALFNLAEDIAAGGDATRVGGGADRFRGPRATAPAAVREYRRAALLKTFRALAKLYPPVFEMASERPEYTTGAIASAQRGYRVIVYGHTHLVKRIEIEGPGVPGKSLYLNTGTWADLIRIPRAVWGEETAEAKVVLDQFLNDLESDTIASWRCAVPTFAKIEVDGHDVGSADVYFADGGAGARVTQQDLEKRLAPEASDV